MAEEARFITRPGETVTAFALGPLEQQHFPGEVTRGRDNVDYKFINGFVDVGELPCRKALRADIAERTVKLKGDFEVVSTNLPGFNRRLEFSSFWHTPTRLSRWVKTRLVPFAGGSAPFRLSTCGGVHIWVDGELITAFEPYKRNAPQETEITLPLAEGGSDVVMLVEEMAERDTNYFVELTWLGTHPLAAVLPGKSDGKTLDTLMELARAVRPAKVAFEKDDALVLVFDRPATFDVAIKAAVHQSVHMSHLPPLFEGALTLFAGARRAAFAGLDKLPDGYHTLELTFSIGERRISREIGFALLRQTAPLELEGDLATRKKTGLSYLAEHGEQRVGRVLARLAADLPLDEPEFAALEDTLAGINSRRDCSDFVMVPLLWIYGTYGDKLPERYRVRIKDAVLNYRYWMDEPGNDTMWFWSENHVLCFHVSELIAGRLFPDAVFANAGLTGHEHEALGEKRLGRWFDAIEEDGLAEWNSAAYYPIDFIGLLALQRFAPDGLRQRAEGILDRLFTMIALHTINGVSAGTMGRAYDKELRAGPLSELAPFATIAFGTGWLNRGVAALPMFCAGDYVPPQGLEHFVKPRAGEAIEARYVQGFAQAARLALYKTATMQLSASIDAAPGKKGHQQHLVDVQAAGHPMARFWVNHPGADDPWGSDRPSYWAGNGIMPRVGLHENCCLILSDLGDDPRLPFTHAYAPFAVFDEHVLGRDWLVLRSGSGFLMAKATGPIVAVEDGPGAGIECRVQAKRSGWAIVVGDLPQGGLNEIIKMTEASELTLGDAPLGLSFEMPGKPSLLLNYESGLFIDRQHCPFPTDSRHPDVATREAAIVPTSL